MIFSSCSRGRRNEGLFVAYLSTYHLLQRSEKRSISLKAVPPSAKRLLPEGINRGNGGSMISLDQILVMFLLVRACRGHRLLHQPLLMLGIAMSMVILLMSACGSPSPPPNPQPTSKPGSSAQANVGSSG